MVAASASSSCLAASFKARATQFSQTWASASRALPSFGYCVIVVVLRSRDASTGGIHHLQEHALFKTAIQTGAGCALKDEPVLVSAISMTVVSLLFIWGTTARFSDSGK